jgi:hypothetical protein
MKIAFECDCVPNCLKYNPAVRRREAVAAEFAPLSGEERYDRRRSPNPFGG